MFEDRMQTTAIPERLYALCCLVKNKSLPESEAREALEPSAYITSTRYFGDVKNAARELGLITIKENEISLAVDKKHLESIGDFKRYVISIIPSLQTSLFYSVSKEYFNMDEKVYKYKSITEGALVQYMSKRLGKSVVEEDMRAWRFWASFLGFGHLHEMLFLPNLQQYIKQIIEICGLEKGKEYSFEDFMAATKIYNDICAGDKVSEKRVCMAFSYGLRALHDEGYIQLVHRLDTGGMWFLYEAELHVITSTVTHITIRG